MRHGIEHLKRGVLWQRKEPVTFHRQQRTFVRRLNKRKENAVHSRKISEKQAKKSIKNQGSTSAAVQALPP